jgi:integrase
VALPHTERVEEDHDRPRPFPPGVIEVVLDLVPSKHRVMFELLAVTGVRRSELLALEGRHLFLNGEQPFIRIRQRVRRVVGEGLVIGPVKSRHSKRDLPVPLDVADKLRALKTAPDALVFATSEGTPHDANNLKNRVLAPACSEAGVEWAGFHTFRHHVASRLFADGRSIVAVQHWLGHHSPSFTLDTYVHLMDKSDIGGALSLSANGANGRSSASGITPTVIDSAQTANALQTEATVTHANGRPV